MSEQAGKLVTVKVSGAAIPISNEPTTSTNDKTYTITNPARQVLDYITPVVVKVGGSQVVSGFKLNRLNGTVTFDTATPRVVTISGAYLPLSVAAYAHEYSLGKGTDMIDVTRFGDEYRHRITGTKYGYGTLKQWDISDTYYETALLSGNIVVLEFKASPTAKVQRLYAILESEELKAAVEGAQDASVSFISTAELLF